jgi:hypothetical protein
MFKHLGIIKKIIMIFSLFCYSIIAKALCVNKSLTSLNLRGNSLGEFGVHAIENALRTNSTLTTLNLD